MRRYSTENRMQNRVNKLIQNFDKCIEKFNESRKFTGPSVYFHDQTINMHKKEESVDLIQDKVFLEYLYATLASWGMHRMGPGNTKLSEFEIFQKSILLEKEKIEKLQNLEIDSIPENELPQTIKEIYQIISRLQVGIGDTKIVIGAKTLHHILPKLVPPIDGEYTMKFFYNNRQTALSPGEDIAFNEMFKQFVKIAKICQPTIISHIGSGMNTSNTKVIDNAIVGYCDLFKNNMN